jgi:hypothetical protein
LAKTIKTTFKVRRGRAEDWVRVNPVLDDGEPGYELDTGRLKIGREQKPWNELDYIGDSSTQFPELQEYVTKTELETLVQAYIPSSDKENQIKVLNDGTMEINSLNISKLV